MNIGVIGTGNVASCLGPLWAARGHRVTYGVRDPSDDDVGALLQRSGPKASAVTVAEISGRVDIILLSVRWPDIPEVIRGLGDLEGRILIDCTAPMQLEKRKLLIGHRTSGAEQIAEMSPRSIVVKAFDTAGVLAMAKPVYDGVRATLFVCGNDARAKMVVAGLAAELGFDVIDAGNLDVARYLEPLAMLLIQVAVREDCGDDIAVKLLRR